MAYKIKISYTTGNSLDSEKATDLLELTWENLDVAKANLKRIRQHYLFYMVDDTGGKNSYWFNSMTPEEKIMYEQREQLDWYCKGKNFHYSIILKTDYGNNYQISPFWVGYFEILHSAEIIVDQSDMKIEF